MACEYRAVFLFGLLVTSALAKPEDYASSSSSSVPSAPTSNLITEPVNGAASTLKPEAERAFPKDCASSYSTTCMKLDIVSWVDRLADQEDVSVLPGVSVVREGAATQQQGGRSLHNAEVMAELARSYPNDADARLDAYLMKKVTSYLGSHSIKVNLFDANAVAASARKAAAEAAGGGKKGGMGAMLLAAGAMMKGTLFALALGALAALAGKALMTGLISLMLSAIIGLKSLAGGGHKQTTYEIVSKPVYSHSQSHSSSHEDHGGHGGGGGGGGGYSGYGRSFDSPMMPGGLQPAYQPGYQS